MPALFLYVTAAGKPTIAKGGGINARLADSVVEGRGSTIYLLL